MVHFSNTNYVYVNSSWDHPCVEQRIDCRDKNKSVNSTGRAALISKLRIMTAGYTRILFQLLCLMMTFDEESLYRNSQLAFI